MNPTHKTILIADDEPHVTYMLAMKLKRAHVTVLAANNGEEALALACQHIPHLIITDYQMPRLSGFDLAVRLRGQPGTSNIPIIMLTARGHRLVPSELARTNIQRLMAKPFSARDLLTNVAEFVDLDETNNRAAA
jgi:two-component system phosphate regulon response regulator PhoB